ncbi:hypothetical protein MMC29_001201 [Sticta canariensis]|nr:hypothetical protein [Sticta canariensis]
MVKPDVPNGPNAVNGASPNSEDPAISRAKQAIKACCGFQDAAKEMLKYSEALGNVEEVLDRHHAMEDATRSNETLIAKLESANQVQIDGYEKRYTMWNEEKCQLERRVRELETDQAARMGVSEKQKATHAQAVAELEKDLEKEKKMVAKLTKELEASNTKTQEANKKIGRYIEQLKDWESNCALLKELDLKVFGEKVKRLFSRCCKICNTHFLRDLPNEAFQDYARWENLPKALEVGICFPPTNSPAAKHMRMAAAMHILADRLCNNFFRPCYLPEYSDGGDPMKEILGQQNPQKERIMRSLLLSTYSPKMVDEAIKQAIQETTQEICQLLNLIGGGEESFRKEVKSLFHEAVNVWKEAQYSKKMVEASTTEDYTDWQWDKLETFTSGVDEIKQQPPLPRFEMLNLFPCIFVPEIEHTVDNGCVLWPAQNTVIAAEQEFTKCLVRKPKPRKPSFVGRRLSSQSDGTNGVKSDERHAFLDTKQRAAQTEGGQAPNGKSAG